MRTVDPVAEFIDEVLGDRPGFDRPYRRGDTVTDANGREWTLVLDHGAPGGPYLRWLHQRDRTPQGGGVNEYRDDLPEGVTERCQRPRR